MIIRIVKMTFKPEKVSDFLEIFERSKTKIRAFEGCESLTLLQHHEDNSLIFTYSKWKSESHLEAYRNSGLFKLTWESTKLLFNDKPEAWTVNILHEG